MRRESRVGKLFRETKKGGAALFCSSGPHVTHRTLVMPSGFLLEIFYFVVTQVTQQTSIDLPSISISINSLFLCVKHILSVAESWGTSCIKMSTQLSLRHSIKSSSVSWNPDLPLTADDVSVTGVFCSKVITLFLNCVHVQLRQTSLVKLTDLSWDNFADSCRNENNDVVSCWLFHHYSVILLCWCGWN